MLSDVYFKLFDQVVETANVGIVGVIKLTFCCFVLKLPV